jgi:nitroreductase
VLVYILSDTMPFTDKKTGEPKASTTHGFDAGAAWVSLALQATRLGYHAHGMSGIQYELVRETLRIPERFALNAACAIGRRGDPGRLDEKLRTREFPSDRKPQAEFVFRGGFLP